MHFSVGDKARIVDGPLEGSEIRIVEMDGGSATSFLKLLGREVKVKIETELLSLVLLPVC
ncbi:transcription termination/antitermination protein NusG [Cochlodiniinecator piscidefendens]|uniref:hypothetical protein n=1 Tax=Cochlodiniinecator piscidefendens TaxID=2715756 RepID=UPI00197B242A|nr:hypothetical protein [Cochlodiniinecator piscidefendens]